MGSPGHQQGSCCSLGAQGNLGAWPSNPRAAGSPQPASLQICCQLEKGEQFHHPWSSKVFFWRRRLCCLVMGFCSAKLESRLWQWWWVKIKRILFRLSLAACLCFPIWFLGHFRKAPLKLWLAAEEFQKISWCCHCLGDPGTEQVSRTEQWEEHVADFWWILSLWKLT